MNELLADLTPAQRQAVTQIEGPLLVLAGPGSGKTRVITRRVVHLLRAGVHPENVLAITFTNKAAGEMRKRVGELAPGHRVRVSTFHSLGAWLLRHYADRLGLDRGFTIHDQADRLAVVKSAMQAAKVDPHSFPPERIQAAISRAKNDLLSPAAYASQADNLFRQQVAKVYPYYDRQLRGANAVDFDDLLYLVALLLHEHPNVRAELDARFRYVMIDEYQDTNRVQYLIAKGLSQDYRNLCVVGDPDQSIYRFRGSDIRNILDFENDYPDAQVVTLDRNYRSTPNILAAADALIAHNRQRKPKRLAAHHAPGEPVQVLTYASGLDEAAGLAQSIRQLVDAGSCRYGDIAVFFRINALSRAFESELVKARIPYQIVRGLAFFERKENKDVLAYLRLLVNPRDDVSFRRAIGVPSRGVGETSLVRLEDYAAARDLSLAQAAARANEAGIKGKALVGVQAFARLLQDLHALLHLPAGDVIRAVLERSGYRRMLATSRDSEDQERLANVEELITAADEFEREAAELRDDTDPPAGGSRLAEFLQRITLKNDVDDLDSQADQVAIMTLHAAKGLEFPIVFMPAMEEGLLPHERSRTEPEELEEERRLAFVGMTRAERRLILSHAKIREFRGQTLYATPSRFLDELPKSQIRWERRRSALDVYDTADYDYQRPSSYPAPRAITGSPRPQFLPAASSAKPAAASTHAATPPARPRLDTDAFQVGVTVAHRDYGQGVVREVSGYGASKRVKVRFGQYDRTFVLAQAPLDVVSSGPLRPPAR